MGVSEKPFVILRPKFLFTFLSVLFTFLHVPPRFSKQFVSISYVPVRSVQTLRNLIKICARILRSYTFRVDTPAEIRNSLSESYVPIRSVSTIPQKSKKLDLKLKFLLVLDNPYRRN